MACARIIINPNIVDSTADKVVWWSSMKKTNTSMKLVLNSSLTIFLCAVVIAIITPALYSVIIIFLLRKGNGCA